MRRHNAILQPALNADNEMMNQDVETSALSCTKRIKLVSKIQEDCDKDKGRDGRQMINENTVVGSSKNKTINLKNHLERCQTRRNRDEGEDEATDTCESATPVVSREKSVMDQEFKHLNVARMIIKNGVTSVKSIKAEIIHVYEEEKKRLHRSFSELSSCFSLTIDCLQKVPDGHKYCCLTVYFIDNNWELQRKVIGFKYPEDGRDYIETCKSLLLEWNLYSSITAVRTGEADDVKKWIRHQSFHEVPLAQVRTLFNIRSMEDFLDGAANIGTALAVDVCRRIRNAFDYIHKTSANAHKFQIAIDKAKSLGKNMASQVVPPSSISNFELLKSALGFREAFRELEKIDGHFKSMKLTKKEWNKATALYEFLKVSDDAACLVNENRYLNANVCFTKACELYKKFNKLESRCFQDGCFDVVAGPKFLDYWNDYILVLAVAVFLDPRFKKGIIESWYKKIYEIKPDIVFCKIEDGILDVFNTFESFSQISKSSTSNIVRSDYVKYLVERKVPLTEEFDILAWWRDNAPKFPIMARMARDFLPIYFSSAVSDSILLVEANDVVGSKGLDSDMVEAFVCTRSWMESSRST